MDKNLQNIEDLFRSALEDNEDEIPAIDSWEAIEKVLDKDHIISIKRKYFTLKKIAAVLLLCLCAALYQLISSWFNGKKAEKKERGIFANETNAPSKIILPLNKENKKAGNLVKSYEFELLSVSDSDSIFNPSIINNKAGYAKMAEHKKSVMTRPSEDRAITNQSAVTYSGKSQKLVSHTRQQTIIENGHLSDSDLRSESSTVSDNQSGGITHKSRRLKNIFADKISYTRGQLDAIQASRQLHAGINKNRFPSDVVATKNTINKTSNKVARFSITPFFSFDFAWNSLDDDKPDNQQGNARLLEKSETHLLSNTAGLLVNYKINRNWGMYSGISFLHVNISMEPKIIYALPDDLGNIKYRINTSSGYGYILPLANTNPAVGDSLSIFNAAYKLQYISIPAGITFSRSIGKFDVSVQAGLSANFRTKATLKTSVQHGSNKTEQTVNPLQGLKTGYLSGLTGVGVDYNLSDKMALSFAPVFRFAISSITKNYTVTSYPMSFGVGVGLKFRL